MRLGGWLDALLAAARCVSLMLQVPCEEYTDVQTHACRVARNTRFGNNSKKMPNDLKCTLLPEVAAHPSQPQVTRICPKYQRYKHHAHATDASKPWPPHSVPTRSHVISLRQCTSIRKVVHYLRYCEACFRLWYVTV